jgi:diaminopimelate decarboxylase
MTHAFTETLYVGENGRLWMDGCDVHELAEEFGTPLYVFSERQLRLKYRRFRDAFTSRYPEQVDILFANKALNYPAVRMIMNDEGAGGDCFGYGELYLSLIAGTPPGRIVVNGSNKTEPELDLAVGAGVLINIDAADEVELIARAAERHDTVQDVGIRGKLLLSDFDSEPLQTVHGTGTLAELVQEHKWGLPWEDTVRLVEVIRANPRLRLRELSYHLGRVSNDVAHWAALARELVGWCARLKAEVGWEPEYLDVGGGFAFGRPEGHGPHGADDADTPTYEEYAEAITTAIRSACAEADLALPKLKVEPGRCIASSAGILVTRVGAVKDWPGHRKWLNVDTSTNHVPHAETRSYYYHMVAVDEPIPATRERVDVVGPLCTVDVLGHGRELPAMRRGDLLALLDTGAYSDVWSAQFNAQPRPASVLVTDGKADVISERETVHDVIGRYRVPPRLLTMLSSERTADRVAQDDLAPARG